MKNNNLKVLVISTVGLQYEGITSVISSLLHNMDLTNMDIYVAGTIYVEKSIREDFESIGCHVVDFSTRKADTLSYFIELVKFIKRNKIQVVHAHGNSATLVIEMVAAWLGGCPKRLAHSHNTTCEQVKVDKLLRPTFNLFYTQAIACGVEAGKWLFSSKQFTVIKNGREVVKYAFNKEKRNFIRSILQIENKIVIGHVGNFLEQKNHIFLVEIYHEIVKREPNCVLFMMGDGPLKHEIEERCIDISDHIVFTGKTDKVAELLNAMDGMLLPSLFEGFPLVVVEWQINGLPCLLADTITKESMLSRLVLFESLQNSASVWAEKILDEVKRNNRSISSDIGQAAVRAAGFDSKESASLLRRIYID